MFDFLKRTEVISVSGRGNNAKLQHDYYRTESNLFKIPFETNYTSTLHSFKLVKRHFSFENIGVSNVNLSTNKYFVTTVSCVACKFVSRKPLLLKPVPEGRALRSILIKVKSHQVAETSQAAFLRNCPVSCLAATTKPLLIKPVITCQASSHAVRLLAHAKSKYHSATLIP